ncbi:phosphate ABC transporter substrate-binding protein [candidate division WOR-3 bacterium]|nr:phosphate ABC transporter substrate-binding protein [candidate division WOR-3 bacterium]
MLRLKKLGLLILIASFVTVYSSEARKRPNTLTITGSTTVLPIAQRTAEEFMELHPKVNISVRGGGSGVGIAALIDGTCSIADASRPIKTKEIATCRSKGINPVGTVIAKDGIAIIVHPSNSVKELSLEQLKAIYAGEISKWSEVGGKTKPIVAISRDVASGTFEVFKKLVLKGGKTKEDALMLASNKAVATAVVGAPDAIGYVGIGYLSSDVKSLVIEGVTPTNETVVSGEYKIARPLYMYTNGEPKGLAKEFIDFILSEEGQKIVEKVGFVPIK